MGLNSIGDLARGFALRQQNTNLKNEIQTLNAELSTSQAVDLADHLGGSYARLTSIERESRLLDGYTATIAEGQQFAGLVQTRLEQINEMSADFARTLIAGDSSSSAASQTAIADEARLQFNTVVSMLNSQSAGRSLFSGDATDQPALMKGPDILAQLETIVAGTTTAAAIETAVDSWFSDPAGFDTIAYSGSDTPMAPFRVSETAELPIDIRANNPFLKDTLKSLALAALSDSTGVSLPAAEVSDLFRKGGEDLLTAERDLVGLQAQLGLVEEKMQTWTVRNEIERSGLDYAKGALLAIDPYEAATELEAAQFQLESLYAVTVRLSQLSLVNFLR